MVIRFKYLFLKQHAPAWKPGIIFQKMILLSFPSATSIMMYTIVFLESCLLNK